MKRELSVPQIHRDLQKRGVQIWGYSGCFLNRDSGLTFEPAGPEFAQGNLPSDLH